MDGDMILDRAKARALRAMALAVALGCTLCVPARADVIEIGEDGPRWVAGGASIALVDAAIPTDGAAIGDIDLPAHLTADHIIADPAISASVLPANYATLVHRLSAKYDLSPALIEALVWQESRWRPDAVSPVGARGLAQLMPGTARDLGVDPRDPAQNLEGGARYLRQQIDRFDGDIEKALAAYNAGPGRVIRAGGIPRIRETQGYVAAIMGRLSDHSR
jgi:hypothetical protein